MRKESDRYKKIVYWSDEDNCFIGMCPELMYGGVHGDDVFEVFKELNEAIEEIIEIYKEDKQVSKSIQAYRIFKCAIFLGFYFCLFTFYFLLSISLPVPQEIVWQAA